MIIIVYDVIYLRGLLSNK